MRVVCAEKFTSSSCKKASRPVPFWRHAARRLGSKRSIAGLVATIGIGMSTVTMSGKWSLKCGEYCARRPARCQTSQFFTSGIKVCGKIITSGIEEPRLVR